jgi:hypothetical protein
LGKYQSDQVYYAVVSSAMRAVRAAQPFDQLSKESYGSWAEITMDFTPNVY